MIKARLIPNYDAQSVLTKVDFGDDDMCWEWNGNIDQYGYGTYGNQNHMVHRVVYELFVDKLGTDEFLDHLCMNRSCVNPNHLEIVAPVVNVRRSNSICGINHRKTHCVMGHEFTPDNTYTPPQRLNRRYCKRCQDMRCLNYNLRTMITAQA